MSVYLYLTTVSAQPEADGEHDWMDPAGGVKSIDNLRAAGNAEGRMYVIPRAGHHGESIFIP